MRADDQYQGGEMLFVVVLGGICPRLVGDPASRIGHAGALLGQLQGGTLGTVNTVDSRQADAHRALPGVRGVAAVP